MSETYTAEALLTITRTGLIDIGYHRDLLHNGYTFADVFAPNQPLRYVDLAAFAQEPPTYRNVCFGVVVPYHDDPEAIMNYRALGAPQILALHPQEGKILLWQMLAQGMPKFIEAIEPAHLSNTIQAHRDDWNPEQVFRAKSIRFTSGPVQLDFFDAGLVPTLEDKVHEKLSKLLEDVIASCESVYKEHRGDVLNYRMLFRLIFRLVAAKLLADRGHAGDWHSRNVQKVLREVENFYFQHTIPGSVLNDPYVQDTAWKHLANAFSFQNLSVEALAYVYENTLVSPEKRRTHGIHATPPSVAEYLVQNLPFDELAQDERRVFEPFCGHAPFLTAAVKKLRTLLLPENIDAKQRHDYLVQMVAGMERDSFACEVALNCLIETDYPNPNGWRIENTDAFSSSMLADYLWWPTLSRHQNRLK